MDNAFSLFPQLQCKAVVILECVFNCRKDVIVKVPAKAFFFITLFEHTVFTVNEIKSVGDTFRTYFDELKSVILFSRSKERCCLKPES